MSKKSNPKDVKQGCLIIVIFIAAIIAVVTYTCDSEPTKELTKQELRTNKINSLIYSNGMESVNIKLDKLIEKSLNDPNSLENISLKHIDKDSIIIIQKDFTAKNAFGGRVKKSVVVSIDTLGNIKELIKWFD